MSSAPAGHGPPTSGTVDLTVVVPAYNEEHRLPRTLDAICRYLRASPGRHADWEVVVVDDGSTDATAAAVREAAASEPRIRLLGPPSTAAPPASFAGNHGKGHAVRMGVLASRGRRVLVTDADLATPIEELASLHDRLDAGWAAAIGSRAHPGADIEVRQHPLRQLLGRAGNRVIRAVAVPGIRDTQCGFKLFDGDRARAALGRSRVDGWSIDVEILRMFHEAGWPVAEVPVRWAHQTGSKVRPLDYGRVLVEVLRLRAGGALRRVRPADRAVLLGYLLLSVWLYKGLWADLDRGYLADSGHDQNQWEWFFAVTAKNVFELNDPFFTTLQNMPLGVNLMANTTMLGLSVPLAPVTALLGPGVTWALVLTGGLAGTAAAWYWLLVKWFVRSRRAAALGGALCAFAPPMISHANAHPNFAVLFVMPLIVDRLLRLCGPRPGAAGRELAGRRGTLRDGVILGLLLTYQVFLGEEALLLAAMGLSLFAVGYAAARPAVALAVLRPLARGLALAMGVALLLLCYPLGWQFFGEQSYTSVLHGPNGNPPRALVEFAGRSLAGDEATADALALNRTEQNAFFGWPLVVFVLVVVVRLWRDPRVRGLAVVAVGASVLSLGRTIPMPGTEGELPGPWRLLADLPLFESVIESRMAMVAVPAAGILLALACDRLTGPDRRPAPVGSAVPVPVGSAAPEPAAAGRATADPEHTGDAKRPTGEAEYTGEAEHATADLEHTGDGERPTGTGRTIAGVRVWRAVGWVAVVAALLPIAPTPMTTVDRRAVPSFVADGTWRDFLPKGYSLVPVPLPGPGRAEALHWQAEADLGFPIPGGYFNGPYGPDRIGIYGPVNRPTADLLEEALRTGQVPEIGPAQRHALWEDLRFWRAGVVVLAPQPGDQVLRVTVERLLGAPGRWIGGMWIWQVPGVHTDVDENGGHGGT
ncbi:dolichyl-phosphate beta-glucosyltransferase [Streptomyces sp. SAJ15]|uniref:dolichyl-phosphate beta-glucosyltransferase n=1 Tax=Streptomyces sp. SAJ15 TaxID=2011095 RepID=UPI00135E43D6|nr:dolichyl-phosphate beta-glucosyltransferase [Streptomyces sp. SAJ15]TVL89365.1 glycosyl transferase [Streptomyces sp. SAJ15]